MEQVLIMGGGPAGVSAALYARRGGLDPLLIHHGPGALAKAECIENYYGLERPLTGLELYERGLSQAKALGIRILEAEVLEIGGFDTFEVKTTAGDFETVSVILATGSKRLTPDIKGVKELEGRGVSYCAICDAFFYRGKQAAVLGNADFALHEAELLSQTGVGVTILTDGKPAEFSRKTDLPVLTGKVLSVEGTEKVTGVLLEGSEEPLLAEGIFVALGNAGSAEIARQMGAELNEKGNIKVDDQMSSTIPGLYAAGDCAGGLLQVAKAVHEGAVAGLSAVKYVKRKK